MFKVLVKLSAARAKSFPSLPRSLTTKGVVGARIPTGFGASGVQFP